MTLLVTVHCCRCFIVCRKDQLLMKPQLFKGAVSPLTLLCPVLKVRTPAKKGSRGNMERRKFLCRMFLSWWTCGVSMYFL